MRKRRFLIMSNTFLNGMKQVNNYTITENGALTHTSTMNSLLDLFAMGAAYRTRTDEDVILLFKNAFAEDPTYALKCLSTFVMCVVVRVSAGSSVWLLSGWPSTTLLLCSVT
jgi:hypothetical protein